MLGRTMSFDLDPVKKVLDAAVDVSQTSTGIKMVS